jgi:hypothetical protein
MTAEQGIAITLFFLWRIMIRYKRVIIWTGVIYHITIFQELMQTILMI